MDKRNLIKISRLVVMAVFCFSLNVAKGEEPLQRNPTEQTKEEGTQTSQATITARPAQEIELEVVWEKQFDEPVVDVIFDDAEVTVKAAKAMGWKRYEEEKEAKKIILPKVKVIETEMSLKFFDRNEKLKKEILFKEINPKATKIIVAKSRNEKYIGVLGSSLAYKGGKTEGKFTMIDTNGEILWDLDISDVAYAMPYISPDGRYIVCTGDITGDFSSYCPSIRNSKGLVKRIEMEGDEELDTVDFSENGEYIALTLNDRRNKKSYIVLLDRNGTELWKKELETSAGFVSISKNWISCQSSSHTNTEIFSNHLYIFSLGGALMTKIPIKTIGSYETIFSKDEKIALVVGSARHVFLYDITDKKLLWEYKDDLIDEELRWGRGERKGRFRGVATSLDFSSIVVADPGYGKREDYIYLFSKEGKELLIENLGMNYFWTEKYYPYRAEMKIFDDGKIFLKTKSGIKILKYDFSR